MRMQVAILAAAFLAACQTTGPDGFDGGQPNILVMGEDADPGTLPRLGSIFKRVQDALANELNDEGFNVYDETAVTLDNFAQGRIRRTDAEIIDIARSVQRPPIDVAVIYAIYVHGEGRGHTGKLFIRIPGRLLNVRTGRRLGNFEVELPRPANVSPRCDVDCLSEAVGRNARTLARDLGVVLAAKLDRLARSPRQSDTASVRTGKDRSANTGGGLATAYSLHFVGFSANEMTAIEDRITNLAGFEHYRPVRTSLRSNEYWYETSATSAQMNRALRQMFKGMDHRARVSFAGSHFKLEKF
ncbi:MAG: hypothetical protein QF521_16135 [Alphaproteobacteria bacterium]|nr:hypothetical protein [Alphaproteobacteria bacterium]